jgi:Winged helix DNA-binding domain
MDRQEALARRLAAQQLDRPPAERALTDATVLDLGVQDTGRDGASWALANRGVPVGSPAALAESPDLALVWSLRGAPHCYRRADLRGVLDATAPYSDADARKRTLDASRPLTAAGIGMREGMDVVAATMRAVVTGPTPKGALSGALTDRLPAPYLRWCNPCQATHVYEQTFRLSALAAGLELEPGTSPPVVRRIPGWRRAPALGDPRRAPEHLRVVDAYLRLCGPTTPAAAATFVDTPPAVVKEHWPAAAEQVDVGGSSTWALPDLPEPAATEGLVRLLGSFDLWLQARDRDVVLPDRARHKALWPTIGRPGAVLVGTDVVGTWRPKASGKKLSLVVEEWQRVAPAVRELVAEQAERLAAHRGATLASIAW